MTSEPVKLFAAILYREEEALTLSLEALSVLYGECDFVSSPIPFDITTYYESEMGDALKRVLVSFRRLADASMLPEFKIATIAIENRLRLGTGGRSVNIDSGYMDFDKAVLASTKRGPYKIYINQGIWADMLLHYERGHFEPLAWSFADFKDGRYEKDCLHIRELYKKGRKLLGQPIPAAQEPLDTKK